MIENTVLNKKCVPDAGNLNIEKMCENQSWRERIFQQQERVHPARILTLALINQNFQEFFF